jgi:hypothetical protein
MQVPSNLFLNKIGKPALYLPTCMIIWGIISGATAGCQSYSGLVACRFMLGFIEAAYFVSLIPLLVIFAMHKLTDIARLPILSLMLVYSLRTRPSYSNVVFGLTY